MTVIDDLLVPVIGVLAFSMPILAIVLPLLAMRRWSGAWRMLAALTIIPIAFDIARIVTGLARDPTSHNLFPLEMILWSVPGLALLFLVWLIRLPFRPHGGVV